MITENHVQDLLSSTEPDPRLVVLEGHARVVGAPDLRTAPFRGAVEIISRDDLVDRLGSDTPPPDVRRTVAGTLRAMAASLGA